MRVKPNRISVSLTDPTFARVSEKADEHGVSMSALVSIMVTEWLDAHSMVGTLSQLLEQSREEKRLQAEQKRITEKL
jgi:hypothetical protein